MNYSPIKDCVKIGLNSLPWINNLVGLILIVSDTFCKRDALITRHQFRNLNLFK
jgi:hypothetical protein